MSSFTAPRAKAKTREVYKSKTKSLAKLRIPVQRRSPVGKLSKPFVGLDSETDLNGDILCLCDSDGRVLERPTSFEEIAKFLLAIKNVTYAGWNAGFDTSVIMKYIPSETLARAVKEDEISFRVGRYRITWIPKRVFAITDSKDRHNNCSFYDFAQFYGKPLAEAFSKYIGPVSEETQSMKEQRKWGFTLDYYNLYKEALERYCINDAKMTAELAEYWANMVERAFNIRPRKWISSGFLAERALLANNVEMPLFSDVPYEIQELAYASFWGGRFELVQRGFIGECYLYDINSAYPYAMSLFPNLKRGKWVRSKRIETGAYLGFFRIIAEVPHGTVIAPFPFRNKDGLIAFPSGTFETCITLDELITSQKDKSVSVTILDSYQWIPEGELEFPLREFMESNYKFRLELKKSNDPLELAVKIILNSCYGKTVQTKGSANLFFPLLGAFITGMIRASLYNFVKDNKIERETVSFATDSIAVTRKLPYNSLELGALKLDKEGFDTYIISNGFYKFNGKWKQRGLGRDREKDLEIEHIQTRVDTEGRIYIQLEAKRPTNVKEAIRQDRQKEIGAFKTYMRKLDLNSDTKRLWDGQLVKANDTVRNTSTAIPVEIFACKEHTQIIAWGDEEDEHSELKY